MPHEWSIHELIAHMADSECMGAIRVRKLIAEPGSTLMMYEEVNGLRRSTTKIKMRTKLYKSSS